MIIRRQEGECAAYHSADPGTRVRSFTTIADQFEYCGNYESMIIECVSFGASDIPFVVGRTKHGTEKWWPLTSIHSLEWDR